MLLKYGDMEDTELQKMEDCEIIKNIGTYVIK